MSPDIGIGAYFHQNAPAGCEKSLIARAVNALRRRGIVTMNDLSNLSSDSLATIHTLGDKSLSLVSLMQERFRQETSSL